MIFSDMSEKYWTMTRLPHVHFLTSRQWSSLHIPQVPLLESSQAEASHYEIQTIPFIHSSRRSRLAYKHAFLSRETRIKLPTPTDQLAVCMYSPWDADLVSPSTPMQPRTKNTISRLSSQDDPPCFGPWNPKRIRDGDALEWTAQLNSTIG